MGISNHEGLCRFGRFCHCISRACHHRWQKRGRWSISPPGHAQALVRLSLLRWFDHWCKQNSTNFTAGAGSAKLSSQRQTQRISNQLPHPQYNSRLIDWDYMVITTSGSWDFSTEYVKPIELVGPADNELPNGTPCQTSGYGYSEYILGQPAVIASTLQWIDMQCITTAECKKTWRNQTLGPRQQCAEVSGGTSCMGDSGGPLTVMEDGARKLLANVSWGHSGCASNGYPSAYSRNADPTANAWIRTNAGL